MAIANATRVRRPAFRMAELRIAHANQIKDKTGIPRRINMNTDITAGNIATNGGVSKETLNGRHGYVFPESPAASTRSPCLSRR